ncbi:hypothetical protein [Microcystis phage Mwe-Yong1]|nr:hypothetical protein [Microcystis phage Mwe-Yong1]
MVAYNFKTAFVPDIQSFRKRQTVRRNGAKRHARPGERVQLYQGLRTRFAQKIIDDPVCVGVDDITIEVSTDVETRIGWIEINGQQLDADAMQAFALADGFRGLPVFGRFWMLTHGAGLFFGVVIRWDPTR